MNLSIPILIKAIEKKSYQVFMDGDYNLNIIGIRSNDETPNVFNDMIAVFYKIGINWHLHTFEATTDPGTYYLKKPLNVKGTAILVPDQYRGVYALGFHQGQYLALVQRFGAVKVFRDSNRDIILDRNPDTKDSGWFGINIHRAGKYMIPMFIDKLSAGCQVIRKYNDFKFFMNLCQKSSQIWGGKFTYTLLEEDDLQ